MGYKWWLLISACLFGIGLIVGLATPADITSLLSEEVSALEELAYLMAPLPQIAVFGLILVKNVSALVISLALSPVLCLVPIMALTINGWLLGLVSTIVLEEESLGFLLAGLLPHGIFEIPALIMGEAVALSFGTATILALFKKEKSSLPLNLKRNLRYFTVALALLLLAAIIETYVTPLLLD